MIWHEHAYLMADLDLIDPVGGIPDPDGLPDGIIPEPGTGVLVFAGLLQLAFRRRQSA